MQFPLPYVRFLLYKIAAKSIATTGSTYYLLRWSSSKLRTFTTEVKVEDRPWSTSWPDELEERDRAGMGIICSVMEAVKTCRTGRSGSELLAIPTSWCYIAFVFSHTSSLQLLMESRTSTLISPNHLSDLDHSEYHLQPWRPHRETWSPILCRLCINCCYENRLASVCLWMGGGPFHKPVP